MWRVGGLGCGRGLLGRGLWAVVFVSLVSFCLLGGVCTYEAEYHVGCSFVARIYEYESESDN